MKNIEYIGNKTFQNENPVNKRTQFVSKQSIMIGATRRERLETPTPYCLCHRIEPKPSTLETKHCSERNCPYLVFVREVWTFPDTEDATKIQGFMEVKLS